MRVRSWLIAALIAGTAIPSLASASTPSLAVTTLANTVVPGLSQVALQGAAPSTQHLQVTVALAHPNLQGEAQALRDVYDKSSPSFHHFLTPAQYASRFGVDLATYTQVTSWLTRNGLTVGYASPARTQVLVEGTVAQAEMTFGVTLNSYVSNGVTFRANPQPATVPVGVVAVQGLQTASSYVLPKRTAQDACLNPCLGATTPKDLWSVYELPSSSTGKGVRAAVLGEGSTTDTITGLRNFEKAYGLPQVPTRSVYVANNKTNVDGTGEWQIDSQAITGMAPDLEELSFYFSQDLTTISDAMSGWVNDPQGPTVADMSIGGCETLNLALGSPVVEQPLLRQGALEGRSLFVSTGDTGGSCLFSPLVNTNGVENTGVPNPQWPSTSDAVIGVGGTVLYTKSATDPTRTAEYTWTHGGGGTSSFIPAPPWQTPISVVKAPCSTSYDLQPVVGYVTCRGVPDVSAQSGDILTNGYTIYDQSNATFSGGGTSLASPLWAGMWARVQGASTAPLGLATPLLYGLANQGKLDAFYDISVGTNVQWQAQPRTPANPTGWDYTNGLGVPVLSALMTELGHGTTGVGTNPPRGTLDTEQSVSVPVSGSAVCGGHGVLNDPAGDSYFGVGPTTSDMDLLQSTYAVKNSAFVVTAHVVNLAAPEAQEFDFLLTLGSRHLQVVASRGLLSTGGGVYDVDSTVFVTPTGFDAAFDDASSTVTVTIPLGSFNTAMGTSLAAGSVVSGLNTISDVVPGTGNSWTTDVPVPMDQIDGTTCGPQTI